MHPFLIDLGSIDLPWLGGVPLRCRPTACCSRRRARCRVVVPAPRATPRVPDELLYNLGFYSLLAGILGAKATLVALDLRTYLEHPAELLGTLRSAGVLLGGVISGRRGLRDYARRHGLPVAPPG